MGPPSYMRSIVDQNVVMRRIPVHDYVERKRTWRKARKEREEEKGKRHRAKSVEGIKIEEKQRKKKKENIKNQRPVLWTQQLGRNSSVGMVTSYGMEGPAFESRQGQDISLLQTVQTGSGTRSMGKATGEWRCTHTSIQRKGYQCVEPYLFFCCSAATQRGSWPPHSRGSRSHTTTHHSR
jgi:hypothetical protein